MAQPAAANRPVVTIGPNPLATNTATLRYSLAKAGELAVRVVDVTGRTVLARTYVTGRAGAVNLDLANLNAGVYLVKLRSAGFTATQKLVVER